MWKKVRRVPGSALFRRQLTVNLRKCCRDILVGAFRRRNFSLFPATEEYQVLLLFFNAYQELRMIGAINILAMQCKTELVWLITLRFYELW